MNEQYQKVAEAENVPPGQSMLVTVNGKEVALFNVEGRFYAIGNRCPHRSGPLVRGRVETVPCRAAPESVPDAGGAVAGTETTLAVRCPIHGWLFELATGRCLTRPSASTPVFPVTCQAGELFLGP